MSNLQSCLHLSMLEALVSTRICASVMVDEGRGSVHVPATDIASSTSARGETVHIGPVSVLDADVEISQFDEASATIVLLMADGRAVSIAIVRPDADVVIH